MRIAIITAIHRELPQVLQRSAIELAWRASHDRGHEFGLFIDFTEEPARDKEASPWSRLCRVADKAIRRVDLKQWDFVFWADADVVDYPQDVCSQMLNLNPTGITAPLPLIEGSARFYDTAACIMAGKDAMLPSLAGNIEGRNLQHDYPYWPHERYEAFVDMDCVGMCFIAPASVLMDVGVPDHPAFTGWYGMCQEARRRGLRVGIARDVIASHANLPKHGLSWH